MLQELVIHDFAIIDQLAISFDEGMTVLSGETGAGKSIIIDAVGLLAGGRGSQDFIRTGAKKATLEGLFTLPENGTTAALLAEYGIEHDDQTILLQRDLALNGHNVCRVNGHLVNTTTLKKIGETLVDIHGQNEHQELMYPDRHLGLLDEFAHTTLASAKAAYQETYQAYRQTEKALKKKQQNEQEWAQRLDMLKFQTNEIDAAQLQPDEESKLIEERAKLSNFQRINQALQASRAILSGEEGNALDQIAIAMNQMQEIAELDPEFKRIADNLQTGYYTLQDSGSDISREVDNLEWDEARLDEIEQRLETINNLEHKYGDSIPEILAYGAQITKELQAMQATEANNLNSNKPNCCKKQPFFLRNAKQLLNSWKRLFTNNSKRSTWLKRFSKLNLPRLIISNLCAAVGTKLNFIFNLIRVRSYGRLPRLLLVGNYPD